MQVDCFKRNWRSKVCVPKCKFHWECRREQNRLSRKAVLEKIAKDKTNIQREKEGL